MSLLANQRARSATEIVDASIQFCRAHALTLLTIAAIVTIPPAVIGAFVPLPFEVIIDLIGNLALSVGGGAASVYTVAVMTEGEISVGESFRRVPTGSVIAASIAFGLAVFLGTLLLVVPGLIFLIRFCLGTTVAAVEGTNSDRSLRRSWALTNGHALHVLGTLAIGVLVGIIVFLGGGLLLGWVAGALSLDEKVSDVFVAPLLMIIMPFLWILATMLYIDLRVRVEGADIEAMVSQMPHPSGPVT